MPILGRHPVNSVKNRELTKRSFSSDRTAFRWHFFRCFEGKIQRQLVAGITKRRSFMSHANSTLQLTFHPINVKVLVNIPEHIARLSQ